MPTPVRVSRVCDTYDYGIRACTASLDVFKLDDRAGYYFVSDLQIDLDGSPQAYHPRDRRRPDNHSQALDWLTSVNVNDLHGIQGQTAVGPKPGYYVSGTTYEDFTKATNDAARYVDSGLIPYIVLTSAFPGTAAHPRVRNGDCGVVVNLRNGRWTPIIFADVGRAVGEASLKAAQNLGYDPTVRPNTNYPPKVTAGISRKDFFYLVFPGTAVAFPLTEQKIRTAAEPRFRDWGGMDRVRALYPNRQIPSPAAPAAAGMMMSTSAAVDAAPEEDLAASAAELEQGQKDQLAWQRVQAAIEIHGDELAAYPGVVLVRPGWRYSGGRMTLEPCVSVCVLVKRDISDLDAHDLIPARLGKVPVDVCPASIEEQARAFRLGGSPDDGMAAAGAVVAEMAAHRGMVDTRLPDDDDATFDDTGLMAAAAETVELIDYVPPDVPLKAVNEQMTIQMNSGPDSGWKCLSAFFGRVEKHLNATMYEFTAQHILDRLIKVLGKTKTLGLIMDFETDDGLSNEEIVPKLRKALGKKVHLRLGGRTGQRPDDQSVDRQLLSHQGRRAGWRQGNVALQRQLEELQPTRKRSLRA